MDMSMQQVLFVMALLAFASGAVLAGASVHYYVTNDIRGVKDDLGMRMRRQQYGQRGGSSHARESLGARPASADEGVSGVTAEARRPLADGSFRITKSICLYEAKEGAWL